MTQVLVPVRYPLTEHSRATVERAIEVAAENDASLTVLHINRYHDNRHVSRSALKNAVEDAFGTQPDTRYVVRDGLLVEEAILDEVASRRADVVVIGRKQAGRWRRMVRRIVDDPDIEQFLDEEVDARIVTVNAV